MQYEDIISKFNITRKNKKSCICKCPSHDDKKASLTITHNDKNNKTLIKCGAGCNTIDVLKAVGLTMSDLFDEAIEPLTKINSKDGFKNYDQVEQYLKENHINNDPVVTIYRFKDDKGNIKYLKLRTEGKKFLHVRLIEQYLVWGLKSGEYYETFNGSNIFSSNKRDTLQMQFNEQPKIIYNLNNVIRGIQKDKTIYIVEGEKDADNLIKHGLIATTTSTGGGQGDDKWNSSYSEYFKGAKVVILPDNDKSGLAFAEHVKKSLLNYCYRIQVLLLSNKEKGDVSDWLEEGHGISELFELLKEVKPSYAPWYNESKQGNVTLNRNRLAYHLEQQLDYVIAKSGQGKGMFHLYRDGVYKLNSEVEKDIKPYIYIDNRGSDAIRSIVDNLYFVDSIDFEELYGDENIINLNNGLYNIKTGELTPHCKDYISSAQLNCCYEQKPYNGGKWDNYINDLTEGNEESKLFLQEVAGVILSNIKGYRLKAIIGLQGKGDTGKSQFFVILNKILGNDLVGIASLQKLSSAQFIGSSIYGKRLVFDGELPSEPLSSVQMLKNMSGGDNIDIEFKGKDRFSYKFNGLIAFCCNDMPYLGNDKGDHYYNRFNILQCNNVIPEEKRDPFLADKIFTTESNYIFKWALDGLKRVVNNGYRFTKYSVISNLRDKVKNEQDSVRAFINQNFVITNNNKDKITISELFDKYKMYCEYEGYTSCARRTFRNKLIDFYSLKTTNSKNIQAIHGLVIKN